MRRYNAPTDATNAHHNRRCRQSRARKHNKRDIDAAALRARRQTTAAHVPHHNAHGSVGLGALADTCAGMHEVHDIESPIANRRDAQARAHAHTLRKRSSLRECAHKALDELEVRRHRGLHVR